MQYINNQRSGSEKTNALLNLISHQPDIDNIYLYGTDPYKTKYQLLINKRESVGLKHVIIFELSLITRMICVIFKKISVNTIQIKNAKC